jgi:hypothetical protein
MVRNSKEGVAAARRVVADRQDALITLGEALYKVLPLIDRFGAASIMPELPSDLASKVRQWWQDVPKSREGWTKKSVFEQAETEHGLPELLAVSMSSAEISARLNVIDELSAYFAAEDR